ncbi:MAG: hypothetical protein U0414_04200 [Polyangiaceae bacterium]
MTLTAPPRPQEGSNAVEDPATVRRTFLWCSLAATLLLLPPRQWVSAGIMAAATLGLFVWHRMKLRVETRSASPPKVDGGAVAPSATNSEPPSTDEPEPTSDADPEASDPEASA